MKSLRSTRRFARALVPAAVLGGTLTAGLFLAGPAGAVTGTLTLGGGSLSGTFPTSLNWSGTISTANQSFVDTTAADQGLQVSDATGSGSGWHVTVAATTFTAGVSKNLATSAFSLNGSTSSATASTAPSTACVTTGQCTVPGANTVAYPVTVTTAASSPTPVSIFSAAASSGLGNIQIGGSTATAPVGWWLAVPATTLSGTYTSTVTIAVVSGP